MSDIPSNQNTKPFLDVLRGKPVSTTPIWFMRQAGRYLPEYRELRAQRNGFLDMAYNPDAACEITMQPIRRFHMDAAILFSDILVIPHALGQDLKFVPGEGPKLPPIKNSKDLAALSFKNFTNTLSPVIEAVGKIRETLIAENYPDVALIGFAGSPWTVACYMIEGGGSKDFWSVKSMAYKNPSMFEDLIEMLVESTAQYLINQAKAGAEALQLFDSWSGALDAQQFKRWCIEPTRKIVALVKEACPDIPVIGFPKGAGNNYLDYINTTGIDAAGLDAQTSTLWASRTIQPVMPVQGNLDPACLFAGGDAMMLAIEKIMTDLSKGPFIFNLGHGIHKETPIEHVEVAIKMVREYGKG